MYIIIVISTYRSLLKVNYGNSKEDEVSQWTLYLVKYRTDMECFILLNSSYYISRKEDSKFITWHFC